MLKLALKWIMNEIEIWSSLDHKYILKFRGTDKKPKVDDSKDGGDDDGEASCVFHKG